MPYKNTDECRRYYRERGEAKRREAGIPPRPAPKQQPKTDDELDREAAEWLAIQDR